MERDYHRDRRRDLADVLTPRYWGLALGQVVDVEDMFLLGDAIRAYASGADAASLFCSHAACERDLAALIDHSPAPPKGFWRWGLGQLIDHLQPSLPTPLHSDLTAVNDARRSLYHYGHSDSPDSLQRRAISLVDSDPSAVTGTFTAERGYEPDPKELWRFAIGERLRRDALLGVKTGVGLRLWLLESGPLID